MSPRVKAAPSAAPRAVPPPAPHTALPASACTSKTCTLPPTTAPPQPAPGRLAAFKKCHCSPHCSPQCSPPLLPSPAVRRTLKKSLRSSRDADTNMPPMVLLAVTHCIQRGGGRAAGGGRWEVCRAHGGAGMVLAATHCIRGGQVGGKHARPMGQVVARIGRSDKGRMYLLLVPPPHTPLHPPHPHTISHPHTLPNSSSSSGFWSLDLLSAAWEEIHCSSQAGSTCCQLSTLQGGAAVGGVGQCPPPRPQAISTSELWPLQVSMAPPRPTTPPHHPNQNPRPPTHQAVPRPPCSGSRHVGTQGQSWGFC